MEARPRTRRPRRPNYSKLRPAADPGSPGGENVTLQTRLDCRVIASRLPRAQLPRSIRPRPHAHRHSSRRPQFAPALRPGPRLYLPAAFRAAPSPRPASRAAPSCPRPVARRPRPTGRDRSPPRLQTTRRLLCQSPVPFALLLGSAGGSTRYGSAAVLPLHAPPQLALAVPRSALKPFLTITEVSVRVGPLTRSDPIFTDSSPPSDESRWKFRTKPGRACSSRLLPLDRPGDDRGEPAVE